MWPLKTNRFIYLDLFTEWGSMDTLPIFSEAICLSTMGSRVPMSNTWGSSCVFQMYYLFLLKDWLWINLIRKIPTCRWHSSYLDFYPTSPGSHLFLPPSQYQDLFLLPLCSKLDYSVVIFLICHGVCCGNFPAQLSCQSSLALCQYSEEENKTEMGGNEGSPKADRDTR